MMAPEERRNNILTLIDEMHVDPLLVSGPFDEGYARGLNMIKTRVQNATQRELTDTGIGIFLRRMTHQSSRYEDIACATTSEEVWERNNGIVSAFIDVEGEIRLIS
jgi:hypothetical protein